MDFVTYATTLEVFRSMIHRNNQELEAFSKLAVKVPKRNCPLGQVADLLLALTNAVAELDQIVMCKGRVLSVDMEQPTVNPLSSSRNSCTDYIDFTVDCDRPASTFRDDPAHRDTQGCPLHWVSSDGDQSSLLARWH